MPTFIALLMRLLALAAGLVFAASVLTVAFVGAALWLLHSGWARLTGRSVGSLFQSVRRHGFAFRPAPRFVPQRARVPVRDITDVQPK